MDGAPDASGTRRPRALVVDDDVALRELVAGLVRAIGDVVEAETPAIALTHLGPGHRFDAVFVTCLRSRKPPHYPGAVQLVHHIFRRSPALSVIVVADPEDAECLAADVLLSGVRHVVRLPLDAGEVTGAFERVVREHPVRRPPSPRNVAAIRRVLHFLDQHAGDVPALSELAVMAAMSRSHFSRTFHAVVGMPLRDYVRDLRLKCAHELLVRSALSLTSIAVESGFYDLPHFDKAFRNRLGISPHAFRMRYGAQACGA